MSSTSSTNACNSCQKTFEDTSKLKEHKKNYHQSSVTISYINHEGESNTINSVRNENGSFTCPICLLESVTTSGFRSHFIRLKGNCIPELQVCVDGVACSMKSSLLRTYKCILCNIDMKDPKEHFENQHPNYDITIEKFGKKRNEPIYDDLFYDRDDDFKRIRAEPLMKAFGLELININLQYNQNSLSTAALVNEKTSRILKQLPQSTEDSLNASMTFQSNELQPSEAFAVHDFQKNIKRSNFPYVNDVLGPYIELNDDIEEKLQDLNLTHIVNIFSGSIIASNTFSLLVLTAEIYSRNGFMDVHAEKTGDSFPESIGGSSNRYKNLKICVIKESEGGGQIFKLNIGTKKFNILITGSLMIHPTCESSVLFGPQCQPLLQNQNLNRSCLFFQKNKVENFEENTNQLNKLSLCRQLNSAFTHKSTYSCYRSNLFENNLRQPATLFTLFMLPNNGYGSSSTNSCREVSLFFSFVFECCNGLKSIKDIDEYFDSQSTDSKLNEIVISIKNMIKDNQNTDILQALSEQKGVSALAQSTSAPLSLANKKLANATFNYIQKLFNH